MNQYFSSRTLNFFVSIIGAFLFWQIMTYLSSVTDNHPILRVWGGSGVGFLKVIAYAAFIFGMLDLYEKKKSLRREYAGFQLGLLPTQEQMVLTPDDVANIKMAVITREKNGEPKYLVSSFIKKAATQFRNDNSVSDTMKVMEMQVDSTKSDEEGRLEEVRYIIQTIPMLGFIGTIIELTSSLQKLDKGLDIVRAAMEGAFDATLVALTLTIFLTLYYHTYIGQVDVFYAGIKSYITDNLISRIYNPNAKR
jgi:biopolymer transport protein ExbB/TolQ